MKTMLKRTLLGLGVCFLALQLIPISRQNPPVTQEMPAPKEVRDILKRACYDCHSNETKWPWYSYMAPVKFMVQHNVEEGRSVYNFSTWDQPQGEEKAEAPEEIIEVIENGEMPEKTYLIMHPEAALSAQDLATLKAWANQAAPEGQTGDARQENEEAHH